jgi:hypothetical protein
LPIVEDPTVTVKYIIAIKAVLLYLDLWPSVMLKFLSCLFTFISFIIAHGRWFSPGTPASSTTKTGRHDIAEKLLKVTLTSKSNQIKSTMSNFHTLK